MAIMGPQDLPNVLRLGGAEENGLKLRTLHQLGHPHVKVEISDDQFNTALAYSGNFISQYFPQEERYSVFYTQPMESEYPLPDDAYMIREVNWSENTAYFHNIFSAEMFLFCAYYEGFKIQMLNEMLSWEEAIGFSIDTPYGLEKSEIKEHKHNQPLVKLNYTEGHVIVTPNAPIKTGGFNTNDALNGWVNASELNDGDLLTNDQKVVSIEEFHPHSTVSVNVSSGCFYGCHNGKPIMMH